MPLIVSRDKVQVSHTNIDAITLDLAGQVVTLRGRLHTSRAKGNISD